MDFLDPKKTRRHTILLIAGYILIGIAIIISTIVLVYQANGFGVNGKGQVVQNGLVFLSSQPNPARVYLNGELASQQTNTRLSIPAGRYNIQLKRDGYRDWQRSVSVQGGDVQNFDYPFLFPSQLDTETAAQLPEKPALATQSRDRKWLLVMRNTTASDFIVYDLSDISQPAVSLALPAGVVTSGVEGSAWELVHWSNNNRHSLLKHSWSTGSEYILVDRAKPEESANLNTLLGMAPTDLRLIDNKHNRYHILDEAGTLSTATLEDPTLTPQIQGVLSFKSYGSRTVLYATPISDDPGKVQIAMLVGDTTTNIRQLPSGTTYLLDIAGYRGAQYVVMGASSEGMVYVYKDPIDQINDETKFPSASRALKVANPTEVGFSPNAQYMFVQSGTTFGIYDLFLKRAYVYTVNHPMDQPQAHAEWMDGNHLSYISKGSLLAFDYDRRNQQVLMPADPSFGAFFAPDYENVYSIVAAENGDTVLTNTALRTLADR